MDTEGGGREGGREGQRTLREGEQQSSICIFL